MLLAVADAVGRPVVAGGDGHGHPEAGRLGQDLLHLGAGLRGPGVLGFAPADRDHGRLVGGVVDSGGDGVGAGYGFCVLQSAEGD